MKTKITQISTLLFLAAITFASAQENLTASEFTIVRGGTHGDDNQSGKSLEVKVSPTNESFSRALWLKFDASAYASVASATLHLSGSVTSADGTVFDPTAYQVADDSWTQTAITWNNAPTLAAMIGAFPTTIMNSNYRDYALDVTDYVQQELAGDKIISFFITDPSASNGQLKVAHTASNGGLPYLEISGTLGIEDKNMQHFVTYPNPVRTGESLKLASSTQIENITVFGLDGRLIKKIENIKSNSHQLEIDYLQNKGVYFVQIEDVKGAKNVQKIIKN